MKHKLNSEISVDFYLLYTRMLDYNVSLMDLSLDPEGCLDELMNNRIDNVDKDFFDSFCSYAETVAKKATVS